MTWFKKHKKLTIFLVCVLVFWCWHRYDSRFTPERWAEAGYNKGKYVESLLAQYDLVGMTQAEALDLLGPDQDGEQREEPLVGEPRDLLVYPANGRPGALFPEYLFLYLEDGVVTEVKLTAD